MHGLLVKRNRIIISMINVFPNNITPESIAEMPLKQFEGKIIVADTLPSFHGAIKMLNNYKILGFDTETKPSFKKGSSNKVCMIQIATDDVAFIFRLNKIGFPDELAKILTQASIQKIGLSLRDDFRELSKLRSIQPAGFIDLQNYVEKFEIQDKSLKKLSALILGIRISKSQQTSNWENEVLTEPQLIYAATDAWVCLEIYKKLKEVEARFA